MHAKPREIKKMDLKQWCHWNVLRGIRYIKDGQFLSKKYLLYIPYPILDVIKGFLIRDVINKHDAL